MRVRALQLRVPDENRNARWIRAGYEYDVLGIEVTDGIVRLRVESEQGTPALVESELFELVDPDVPASWVVLMGPAGGLSLEVKAWSRPGFWEEFYDRDPRALELYDAEKRRMRERSTK